MSKPFDPFGVSQGDNIAPVEILTAFQPEPIKPTLTLSKKSVVSEPVYKSQLSLEHHFMSEVQVRSTHDLVMVARDSFHRLYCELPLTFQQTRQERKRDLVLICQFPMIGDCALVDFIEEDEELLGFILITFFLHILEDLLLFGATRKANTLIIKTVESEFQGLEIYKGFTRSVKRTQTQQGVAIELNIPLHAQSLKNCRVFMDDVMEQFRRILWHDQKTNPAIRNYMIHNLRMSIVASKTEKEVVMEKEGK